MMRRSQGCLAALVVLWILESMPTFGAPKEVNIGAMPALEALLEFGRQTGAYIVYNNSAGNVITNPVHGLLEPATALTQMLAGTGLEFTSDAASFDVHKRVAAPEVTVLGHPDRRTLQLTSSELERSATDIAETGILTVPDFLRTLPEVTGGPCDDALVGNNRDTRQNAAQTCGISLHGVSSRGTTVTLNGEPLPMSGTSLLYQGISHIPDAAIELLQIYADTPSLLSSGSPGGTVNFKLLSDFDGSLTRLRYVPGLGGAVGERQFTQIQGLQWGDARGVFLFEYDSRDALPAGARPQGSSDLRPWGGTDYDTPAGSPGTILLPQGTWPIPVLPPSKQLTAQDLTTGPPNLYNTWLGTDLLPRETLWSALLAGHRTFDNGSSLACHSLLSWRQVQEAQPAVADLVSVPASNPYYINPVAGTDPVVVEHGFLSDLGPTLLRDHVLDGSIACGVSFHLGAKWDLRTSASYSFEHLHEHVSGLLNTTALDHFIADSNPTTAFDVFQAGLTNPQTLEALNGSSQYRSMSDIAHWRMLATGPPAAGSQNSGLLGSSRITFALELQRESLRSTEQAVNLPASAPTNLARELAAAVATTCLPFVDRSESCAGEDPVTQNQINLLAGGRYERYNDGDADVSHTISLQWRSPLGLTVEGGWAHSIERGSLADLSDAQDTVGTATMIDPRSQLGYSQVLVLYGGNSTLRPEIGNNLTLTARLEHDGLHAATLSIHYFHDDDSNLIDAPVLSANSLFDPSIRDIAILNPTPASQNLICREGQYPQGQQACNALPVAALIDDRLENISRLVTEGIDVAWKQRLGEFLGDWSFRLDGTYLDRYALHEPTGPQNVVNTIGYPLRFRALYELTFRRGIWAANVFTHFQGSYRDTTTEPAREIRELTTVDIELSVTIANKAIPVLRSLEASAGVHNVFDKDAPFANNAAGLGYDPFNTNLLGRYLTLGMRVRF